MKPLGEADLIEFGVWIFTSEGEKDCEIDRL